MAHFSLKYGFIWTSNWDRQGISSCQPGDSTHPVFPPVESIMPVSSDCFWDGLFFKCLAVCSVYCTQSVTPCCLISIPVSFPLTLLPAVSPTLILPLKLHCFIHAHRQTTLRASFVVHGSISCVLLWQAEWKAAVITCAGWLTHYPFYWPVCSCCVPWGQGEALGKLIPSPSLTQSVCSHHTT